MKWAAGKLRRWVSGGFQSLAGGGSNADLSGSGGTGFFIKQTSVGVALTSAAVVAADLGSGAGGGKYLRDDLTWNAISASSAYYASSTSGTNTITCTLSPVPAS